MERQEDKILGSWFGMAVGDAMGLAVRGLKPETIQQYFKEVDGYKDIRAYIGKGVKQYRMQGLYGSLTQSALAVGQSLLQNGKFSLPDMAEQLQQLAAGGPENNFGVYRHSEAYFRKSVGSLFQRRDLIPAEHTFSSCGNVVLGVPLALHHRKGSPLLLDQSLQTGLMLTRNPWEVTGTALTAALVTQFLTLEADEDHPLDARARSVLEEAADQASRAEALLREKFPEVWKEFGEDTASALSRTLGELARRIDQDEADLFAWICRNASGWVKTQIFHPSQGYVLTLLPLALVRLVRSGTDFAPILTRSLNLGRESDKLGSLVGAWAGALFGFSRIPSSWKGGLVNAREIKARGEALFAKKSPRGLKDLYEMESGLTRKEHEEKKKFLPKAAKKPAARKVLPFEEPEDGPGRSRVPPKEDVVRWRKYQKDKTRAKRERRRKPDWDEI